MTYKFSVRNLAMNITQLLKDPYFKHKKVLRKIISYVENIDYEKTYTDYSLKDVSLIKRLYDEYAIEKKPLEYILGYVEVLGEKIKVTPDVLIPRPETEYLLRDAINSFKNQVVNSPDIKRALVDVGTGCWVLWWVFLKKVFESWVCPKKCFEQIIFTDISSKALKVAKENTYNLLGEKSPQIEFVETSLLEGVEWRPDIKELWVLANLPYIPDETFFKDAEENVKKREPHIAFLGGEDGLTLYRQLLKQLESLPFKIIWFFEMMSWQSDILKKEFSKFRFEVSSTFHFNISILRVLKN